MEKIATTLGAGLALLLIFLILISVVGLLAGLVVYVLWNWLMPVIFGLPEITFWQAWGIWVFSNILFKTDFLRRRKKTNYENPTRICK